MKDYAVLRHVSKKHKGSSWRTCGNDGDELGTFEEKRALFSRLTRAVPEEHYRLVRIELIEDSK